MAIRSAIVLTYLPGRVEGVPAGRFEHDDGLQVGRFEYGRRYRARADALPVDPVACPLAGAIAPTRLLGGFYGAFRDAAPDAWGRLLIARKLKRAESEIAELDVLQEGGAARAGCLDFRADPGAAEAPSEVPLLTNLDGLEDAARKIEANRPVAQDQEDLLRQGSAMGGARPKCVVEHDGELWLAKFPSRGDRYNHPRVEHATMTLAAACGIDVAQTRVHTLANARDVVLVRRFDRHAVAGGFARTGFVSALTVLDVDERDRHLWSYVALADVLRSRGQTVADLRRLYTRMAFNVACRNVDDHPRNHAFFFDADARLRLTPAYDITPSAATPGVGTEFSLAMQVGARGSEATIENLLSAAPRFGLTRDDAVDLVAGLGQQLASWREHFAAAGVVPEDVARFEGSFARAAEMSRLAP